MKAECDHVQLQCLYVYKLNTNYDELLIGDFKKSGISHNTVSNAMQYCTNNAT